MSASLSTTSAPRVILTMKLSASDMDELAEVIALLSSKLDDPDRIAAIRIDEEACCAEMDVADRPVDPRRLH